MDKKSLHKDLILLLENGYILIGPNVLRYNDKGRVYETNDIKGEAERLRERLKRKNESS